MTGNFVLRERYNMEDLIALVKILRAPGGCPWDREQTHVSMRKNLIEETYEVAEAIDREDAALLREELGDLLLQVVLHAQMEDEEGRFCFDDVANDICRKLVIRHPHVFSQVQISGIQDVLDNWEAIKVKTKGQSTAIQTLESVPRTLPGLMRAQKIQHRAAKAGMCYADAADAMGDLRSEVTELDEALRGASAAEQLDEAGDVLFAAVNVVRLLGADAEEVLETSTRKFMDRFAKAETEALQRGVDMKTCTPEVLDALWRAAKGK